MASYATEREIIARFLSVFGITSPRLNDPNAGLKKDTGADVVWTHDEGQTAFQVTEYHSDKGLGPNQKGSQLRRAEKAKAATGRPYGMWVRPDPIPALLSTITQKVGAATRPDRQRFREAILVIAASLPHDGAAATALVDLGLESELPRLNAATHDLLLHSAYDSAYIFNMLSLEGTPVVYKWDREKEWWRLGARQRSTAKAESSGFDAIEFLNSLPPLEAMTRIEHDDGLGPDFLPELLAAFPDREPTPAEIAAFERAFRARRTM